MGTARGFLGAGDLYLARLVNGAYEPWAGPYECSKFEIKPNVTLKEQKSKGKGSYGQIIETVAVQDPADLTVDLTEVNRESLAIALLGTVSAVTQMAGTLAAEAVVLKLDKWVPLSKYALSETGYSLTDSLGTTTYDEGTDYLVNRQLGWIKALSTGTIDDGDTGKFSGGYQAATGSDILGATQAQLRVRFRLDGKNFADDTPVVVDVYEAVIAASSAFDFLGDNFATVSMPGRMKTPIGYTEPYKVRLLDAAA